MLRNPLPHKVSYATLCSVKNSNDTSNFLKERYFMDTSMSLSLFITQIMQRMQQRLGEKYTVLSGTVKKNNGIELIGITIRRQGCNTSPTIYLNDFFREYKSGISIEAITEKIQVIFEQNYISQTVDLSGFTDYEKAKKQIAYKVINFDKNRKLLQEVPHKVIYNLAMVFYYTVTEVPFEGKATILIRNSHLQNWKISAEELYQNAVINAPVMLPAQIENIEKVMENLMKSGVCNEQEDIQNYLKETKTEDDRIPMYVLSNKKKVLGAACMFYPGVLKNFANKKQSNFYILPSSIHEVILLPEIKCMDREFLLDMVKEINQTQVEEAEVLADSIYFYDRKYDKMEHIC